MLFSLPSQGPGARSGDHSRSRPERDNGVAKPFNWEALDKRPILAESVALLIALGAVFVLAFVFLDLRLSKIMSLFVL